MDPRHADLLREIALWGGTNIAVQDLFGLTNKRTLQLWCAKLKITIPSTLQRWNDLNWAERLEHRANIAAVAEVMEIYNRLVEYRGVERVVRAISVYQRQTDTPGLSWDACYAAIKLYQQGCTHIQRCTQCRSLFRALSRESLCPLCTQTSCRCANADCGMPMPPQEGRGRPRRYCSDACRDYVNRREKCIRKKARRKRSHNGALI